MSQEWTTGRVPLIDPVTGRLPDEYMPAAIDAAVTHVDEVAEGIDGALSEMLAKSANLSDLPDKAAARSTLGAAATVHTHQVDQVAGLSDTLAAKADLVAGLIPTSQIPRVAMTAPVVVADEAAMLALTVDDVQPGDVAVREDGAGTWMLRDDDPSVLSSWVRLSAPTDAVSSVNGQVGTVVLSASDVGAATPGQVAEAVAAVEVAAEGWAVQAQGSATAAASSATSAASDRSAAQTARTGAESARDAVPGIVAAQVDPKVAAAEAARVGAETARAQTEAAVTTGLSWQGAVSLASVALAPVTLHATLTGNVTITLPTPPSARSYTVTLVLTQDATGSRTVTISGARASWATAISLTGTPSSRDLIHLLWTGVEWVALSGAQAIGVPAGW